MTHGKHSYLCHMKDTRLLSRVAISRGWRWGKWEDVGQRVKLPIRRRSVSSGDLMHSIEGIVNNTVLYTKNLLRE